MTEFKTTLQTKAESALALADQLKILASRPSASDVPWESFKSLAELASTLAKALAAERVARARVIERFVVELLPKKRGRPRNTPKQRRKVGRPKTFDDDYVQSLRRTVDKVKSQLSERQGRKISDKEAIEHMADTAATRAGYSKIKARREKVKQSQNLLSAAKRKSKISK